MRKPAKTSWVGTETPPLLCQPWRRWLAAARPRQPKNMLDVRRRSGECAADGRIERSAYRGEKENAGDPRADLEAAVGYVLVWQAIACEVE
jgi:hypothetical protein